MDIINIPANNDNESNNRMNAETPKRRIAEVEIYIGTELWHKFVDVDDIKIISPIEVEIKIWDGDVYHLCNVTTIVHYELEYDDDDEYDDDEDDEYDDDEYDEDE